MMLFIIWGVCLLLALHLYLKKVYSRFSRYGVKTQKPLQLLGNSADMLFRRKHMIECIDDLYHMYPDDKFVGRFNFTDPLLVIKDIELIKKIAIKDFEHFIDHKTFLDEENEPIFGRNLFSLKGGEWKDMRSTLSPAFTSSKIRAMVPFINEVSADMIASLKERLHGSDSEYIDVDTKDLTTRVANDVIASCAFGLKVDSQKDRENQFYKTGKEASNFSFRQMLLVFIFMSFPNLAKKLKLYLFSQSIKDFFNNMVLGTMKEREQKNIIRPDMIHLLMEARKGKLTHDENMIKDEDAGFATVEESAVGKKEINRVWSDNDVVAQAFLFFFAGFETVSTAMSFLCHELAINPEVQEKLVQEIRVTEDKTGGKIDYDALQKMPYLDMVVSEILRLWTPAGLLDRVCVKDYNLGKPNENATQDYIIWKGEGIAIPAWQIHRDPKYFPNPLKFDPERFSEENKHNIKPFTYMPFGVGSRNCIGSRFALIEVKVMTYQLLKHFELSPAKKTMIPAKLGADSFSLRIADGHWVRYKIRN